MDKFSRIFRSHAFVEFLIDPYSVNQYLWVLAMGPCVVKSKYNKINSLVYVDSLVRKSRFILCICALQLGESISLRRSGRGDYPLKEVATHNSLPGNEYCTKENYPKKIFRAECGRVLR